MSPVRRPTLLLLPLAWLVVVVLVAGVTWRVIDSAGRQVLTSGGPVPLSTSGATPDAESSPSHDPRGKSTEPPTPSRTPSPSGAATAGASESAPPSDDPPPGQPSAQASQQQPSRTEVRSWQGAAGTVSAACTGATISLQSVTPNDGWGFEVDDRGPDRVRVEFESRGDDEHKTRVEAACAGGAPRFVVEADD